MRYLATENTNLLGVFQPGDTVTISVYDIATGNTETLTSNSCTEIAATGVFKWSTQNLDSQPTNYKEYLWVMSNSSITQQGKVVLNGYAEEIKAQTDKMNFTGTDIQAVASNMRGTDNANTVEPDNTKIEQIKTKVDALSNYDDAVIQAKLDTVQADLDNPDQYKADTSTLAQETTAQAIKTKTDTLPASPASTGEYDAKLGTIEDNTNDIPSDVWEYERP